MSNYTTELALAGYSTYAAWRANDNVIGGQAALALTAAPSVVAQGDAFDELNDAAQRGGNALTCNGTSQYMVIPAAVIDAVIGAGTTAPFTFVMYFRFNNFPTNPGAYTSCGASVGTSPTSNYCWLGLNSDTTFFRSDSVVSIIMASATTAKAAQYNTGGVQTDGEWHQIAFGYDGTKLWIGFDGVWRASATAAGTDKPSGSVFPIGAFKEAGTAEYFCNYKFQYPSLHTAFLSSVQLWKLASVYNGRTGAKVYQRAALNALLNVAKTQIVPILSIGDSNIVRSFGQSHPAENQTNRDIGLVLTTQRALIAATGRAMSASHFTNAINVGGPTYYQCGLMVSQLTAPTADVWSSGATRTNLYSRDTGYDTRVAGGGSTEGWLLSANYDDAADQPDATDLGITIDPTLTDWMMGSGSGNFSVKHEYATQAAGAGQLRFNSTGGTASATDVVNTNTGANGWATHTQTIGGITAATRYRLQDATSAKAPIGIGLTTIRNGQTTGFSYGNLYAYGGHGVRYVCARTKAYDDAATATTIPGPLSTGLVNLFKGIVAHLGQASPTLAIQFQCGILFADDLNAAFTDAFGTATEISNTRVGCSRNYHCTMTYFLTAWIAAGYDQTRLYFIFGPYPETDDHTDPSATAAYPRQQNLSRAMTELAETYPGQSGCPCIVFDGPEMVDYATMNAASGYSYDGPAHLSLAGYRLLGSGLGQAIGYPSTSSGMPRELLLD